MGWLRFRMHLDYHWPVTLDHAVTVGPFVLGVSDQTGTFLRLGSRECADTKSRFR